MLAEFSKLVSQSFPQLSSTVILVVYITFAITSGEKYGQKRSLSVFLTLFLQPLKTAKLLNPNLKLVYPWMQQIIYLLYL